MSDWLKKRLTRARKNSQRWLALAEAIQEFWETYFDPEFSDVLNLRSIYTADLPGLVKIMRELSDYFRDDIGTDEDKPLQIAWRRIELQAKETDNILQMALKRKFLGFDIRWVPLWHSKTEPYGTGFFREDEITMQGWNLADFFLTSRGKIQLASESLRLGTLTYEEFLSAVEEEIERVLPTNVVYEGAELLGTGMNMPLYWGGLLVQGYTTTLQMDPDI